MPRLWAARVTRWATLYRPDHGRDIWAGRGRPGYGLYDRGLGVCYLTGLWEAVSKTPR